MDQKQTIATVRGKKGDVGGLRTIGDIIKPRLRSSGFDVCVTVDTNSKELYIKTESEYLSLGKCLQDYDIGSV